jgi:hypothetical protein
MEKGKMEEACKALCNRAPTTRGPELNRIKSDSSSGSRDAPIDLTCDDSDEDVEVVDQQPEDEATFDLSYHALSQDDAELSELLGTLSGEELKSLAQQNRIATGGKRVSGYTLIF